MLNPTGEVSKETPSTDIPYTTTGTGLLSPIVRLAGIVDVYDALTTDRPYAAARSPYDALELMMNEMESQFDARMLRSFVRFLGPKDQLQEDSVGAGRD